MHLTFFRIHLIIFGILLCFSENSVKILLMFFASEKVALVLLSRAFAIEPPPSIPHSLLIKRQTAVGSLVFSSSSISSSMLFSRCIFLQYANLRRNFLRLSRINFYWLHHYATSSIPQSAFYTHRQYLAPVVCHQKQSHHIFF